VNQLCIASMCESHSCPCTDAETQQSSNSLIRKNCQITYIYIVRMSIEWLEATIKEKIRDLTQKIGIIIFLLV